MDEKMKEVIGFIAGFLVDMTGNELFEKWKSKRKISKILKQDSINIKRIFYVEYNSNIYNLIEEFIMFFAFKSTSFYSSMNLTVEQEEHLWREFTDFIKNETGNAYVDIGYKDKVIRCINLHNEAINNIIMDAQGLLHMKVMQNQHNIINNSLNHIISTLNTETKLQDEDDQLNFSVEQLEMIMKSYRFDINQLRNIQIICILGGVIILLFMSIFVPLALKGDHNIYSIIIMSFFFCVVTLLLLICWRYISKKTTRIETQMEDMRKQIWEIHYKLYKNQIEVKYVLNKSVDWPF